MTGGFREGTVSAVETECTCGRWPGCDHERISGEVDQAAVGGWAVDGDIHTRSGQFDVLRAHKGSTAGIGNERFPCERWIGRGSGHGKCEAGIGKREPDRVCRSAIEPRKRCQILGSQCQQVDVNAVASRVFQCVMTALDRKVTCQREEVLNADIHRAGSFQQRSGGTVEVEGDRPART